MPAASAAVLITPHLRKAAKNACFLCYATRAVSLPARRFRGATIEAYTGWQERPGGESSSRRQVYEPGRSSGTERGTQGGEVWGSSKKAVRSYDINDIRCRGGVLMSYVVRQVWEF